MRIYFSGNLNKDQIPEALIASRSPSVMFSFYFLSKINPRREDKGARKRLKKLLAK